METIASPSKVSPSGSDEPITPADAVRRLIELDDEADRRRWIERCLAACPIDELLPLLKDESERYLNIDPHVASRLAETLVFAGEYAGYPEYRALGLMATGDVYRALGRYREAVAVMDEAGNLFRQQGDEVKWARTRIGWVLAAHRLGNGEAALIAIEPAREILVRHQAWYRAATLDLHAATVCKELGQYERAFMFLDQAQAIYESLGATAEGYLSLTKMNKGNVLLLLGDFQTALKLHEESLQISVKHKIERYMLIQAHNVAAVYAAQGHYTRALQHYRNVLTGHEHAGIEISAAWVALDMVECYLSLNRNDEARDLAEETVIRFERYGTPTEAAKARFFSALAHARLGDADRALQFLNDAAQTFAAVGLSMELALVSLQRATLHFDDEQWEAAGDTAEQASALFAARGAVVRQAQADLIAARAALALGAPDRAAALAEAALMTARGREVEWIAFEAHHLLGAVAWARGDHSAALVAYEQAVASIERLQRTLAVELRTHFLADKLRVYEDAIAANLAVDRPEIALSYLERAKSRAIVDYLASNMDVQIKARKETNPALLETLTRLREEHNGLYNRLYGHGLTQRDAESAALAEETLAHAVREREKEIARLLERLALDRTEGLVVTSVGDEGPTLPRPDAGTVLIEYFFRDDGGTVFVVTPAGVTAVPLAARPREIQRLLQQWQLNLASTMRAIAAGTPLDGLGRNARGILGMLHRAMIAPIAAHLADCEAVVVIPYGPTHAVPFHALFDGAHFLIESVEVVVCPSSSLLALCASHPRGAAADALVVAHSDGGRLPAVRDEARSVSALLGGECYIEDAATRAAVVEAAPRHRIIHLAAHGEARLDNPTFAHLKLADGQLTTADIFNLELDGALVTLSACETGRSVIAGGDEVVGLSRGFLYAGASTLVQSLWRVEDHTTAVLMEQFYRGIRAGQPKGAALRSAQCAMRASHDVHPYFWAPFQLIGDRGLL